MKKETRLAVLAFQNVAMKLAKVGIIGGSLAFVTAGIAALSLDLSERRTQR
jgi:hypothetical protein